MTSSPDGAAQDGRPVHPGPQGKLALAAAALAAGVDADAFGRAVTVRWTGTALTLAALAVVTGWLWRSSGTRPSRGQRLLLILAFALLIPAAIAPRPWAAAAVAASGVVTVSAALTNVKRNRSSTFLWEVLPLTSGACFATSGIGLLAAGRTGFGAAFACFGLGFIGTGAAIMQTRIRQLLAAFALLALSMIVIGVFILLAGDHAPGIVAVVLGVTGTGLSVTAMVAMHRDNTVREPLAPVAEPADPQDGEHGPADDVVVLVHGTFSADKPGGDEGERWWQPGSPTWTRLQAQLSPGAVLAHADGPDGIFRWSGVNSQAERYAASTKLLAYLIRLERAGRRYHLVGHSHGGSLIWEALISSVEIRSRPPRRVPRALTDELESDRPGRRPSRAVKREVYQRLDLTGLRTWTTVGTPFLHHLPRRRRLIRGWPKSTFSLFSSRRLSGQSGLVIAILIIGYITIETCPFTGCRELSSADGGEWR